jgi:hypothetical protein
MIFWNCRKGNSVEFLIDHGSVKVYVHVKFARLFICVVDVSLCTGHDHRDDHDGGSDKEINMTIWKLKFVLDFQFKNQSNISSINKFIVSTKMCGISEG